MCGHSQTEGGPHMMGTRQQIRTVFLAVIILLSVIAVGTAGFGGSAAAQQSGNQAPNPQFDLTNIENQSPYNPGQTISTSVSLTPDDGSGEYVTDANYSIQIELIGPDGTVDLASEEGFTLNELTLAPSSLSLGATGANSDGLLVNENGVVTVSGIEAEAAGNDPVTADVNITADDDASPGEYTFSATVVRIGDTGGVDHTVGDTQDATFDVIDRPPSVNFNDKTVANGTTQLTVEAVNANVDYYVDLQGETFDAPDTQIFSAGQAQTSLTVDLNHTLTQSQTVTATVRAASNDTELAAADATITSSPLAGTAGEFDDDGDGRITAAELGDAGTAFARGDLSAAELGDVATRYAQV